MVSAAHFFDSLKLEEKRMKRILLSVIVLLLVFCCASCNNSSTCIECGQKYETKDNYCSNCGAEIVKGSESTYTKGLSYILLISL